MSTPESKPVEGGLDRSFRRVFRFQRVFLLTALGATFAALQVSELERPWQNGPWLRTFEGWLVCYFAWVAIGSLERTAREAIVVVPPDAPELTSEEVVQLRRALKRRWNWRPSEWRASPTMLLEFAVAIAAIAIAARLPEFGPAIPVLTAAHLAIVVALRTIRTRLASSQSGGERH